jgi:tetratricopeptide (TPR) repeat protein
MRLSVLPTIVFVVLAFPTLWGASETAEQLQLVQAQKLNNHGEFAAVIRILGPLVHSTSGALDDVTRGRAWNLLGPAYEALGEYEAARHCYEMAIQLLQTDPASSSVYASALTHLASFQIYMGQPQAVETLLRKAKGLCVRADDHEGLAEVATILATLALYRKNTHAARGLLKEAFREAEQAKDLNDSDRAEMYSVKGVLAARDRDFVGAVLDYQQSIDFTIRACGPKCDLVALQYMLQADVYRELGEYGKAKNDITAALLLLEQTVGRNNLIYVATELTYARLLRATGAKAEGARKETEAKTLLQTIYRQQGNGCSISAATFR